MEKSTGILLAVAGILIMKSRSRASGSQSGPSGGGTVTLIPGGARSAPSNSSVIGGSSAPSPNNLPALAMPLLPPGTTPEVAKAVSDSYAAGTLTQGQATAVSQLYAPMYGPLPGLTAQDILNSGAGGLTVDNRVDLTPYGSPGQLGTVVDYGSPAAAEAALAAYWNNFVRDGGT